MVTRLTKWLKYFSINSYNKFSSFLVESPRWLLSKGRENRAYKMVFGKKMPAEMKSQYASLKKKREAEQVTNKQSEEATLSLGDKFKQTFGLLHSIYGVSALRKRALICHFTWFVTSLCYYVTALNADNITSNRFIYVAATGSVDILGYASLIFLLRYVGRTRSCCGLFFLSAASLLILLIIPKGWYEYMQCTSPVVIS